MIERPNLILVVLDTARRDRFGCYGYTRGTTPVADDLARQSVVFDRMITTAPWTVPSHASLFTGLYPREHAAQHPIPILRQPITTLASHLRASGYTTVCVSNNYVVDRPTGLTEGFDTLVRRPYMKENRFLLRARKLLGTRDSGAAAANRVVGRLLPRLRRPFFLFVNYMECHWNYLPPRKFERRFAPELSWWRSLRRRVLERDVPMWEAVAVADGPTLELYNRLHDAALACADDRFGRLLGLLEQAGVLDDSVFILASDHGDNIGEEGLAAHQGSLRQNLIHVPFIARIPGRRAARIRGLVQFTDVFAGLCRQLRVPVPDHLADRPGGVDPFGLDPTSEGRSFAFSEWVRWTPASADVLPDEIHVDFEQRAPHFDFTRIPGRLVAVQDGRFKLVVDEDAGVERLFDLAHDPQELRDIAEQEPGVVGRLREAITQWRASHPERTSAAYTGDEQTQVEARLRALGYI